MNKAGDQDKMRKDKIKERTATVKLPENELIQVYALMPMSSRKSRSRIVCQTRTYLLSLEGAKSYNLRLVVSIV